MELDRKKWTKKYLIRLPKDAKPKEFYKDKNEKELIKTAIEEIFNVDLDIEDIIRADILKKKFYEQRDRITP